MVWSLAREVSSVDILSTDDLAFGACIVGNPHSPVPMARVNLTCLSARRYMKMRATSGVLFVFDDTLNGDVLNSTSKA